MSFQTFLHDSIFKLRSTLGEIVPPSCFDVARICEIPVLALAALRLWLLVALLAMLFVLVACVLFTTWLYFCAPGFVVALEAGWIEEGLGRIAFGLV